MSTEFLGLSLTDASETSMKFLEWRQSIDGVGVNSNMELIDGAIKILNEAVGQKADGFTLDEDTGVLQLTSGGVALVGASVTINLNKYYTKEETEALLAELEASVANNETILDIQSRALGELTWDETNRALTMYNLNGEVVGNPLIIEGGGGTGGGGDAYSVRLVNGMSSASFTVASSAEPVITATYYEYYGSELTGVAGKVDVEYKLSTDSEWTSYTSLTVNQGVAFSVSIKEILTLGAMTNIRLTVTGGESDLTRSLTYNVTQVEASIAAVNFDSAATYTGNVDFQYKCVGRNLSKVVYFEIDGTEVAAVDVGTSHNTTLTQVLQMTGVYEYGAHDLKVWFTTSDGAISNVLRSAILYNDGTKQTPMIGVVPVYEEITYGDSMDINYVVFTPGQETTDELNIRVYEQDVNGIQTNYAQTTLVDIPNNTTYLWQGSVYPPSGTAYVEFVSGDEVQVVSIKVNEIETEYDLNPIATNLVYSYSSAGRSNNDSGKELYECEYTTANGVTTNIRGIFDGFNWVSNGYVDGTSLTLSGGATHTIELPMFSTTYTDADGQTINLESASGATVTTNGRTVEMEFMVSNVTDINAHIIKCMSSEHAGFVVTPQNCWLLSSNGTDVALDETGFIENEESIAAAYIKDGVRLRLSFVIEAKGTVQYTLDDGTAMSGQCVNIYINGQFANSFVYPDNARFTSTEYITMGSDTCIMNLYDVRVYNRGLSASEIMQNYCASPLSVQNRLVRFEDNDILTDDGDVDYYEAIKKYNCLLITGPLSPYKGANGVKTDGKYEAGATLTKPDGAGGYVTEFELLDKDSDGVWLCSNNVQGTSSQKFPIKNYKVYLVKAVQNDDGTITKKKVKYALKGKDADGNELSIGESTLCWKADYMSSDHANTFNANLADTLFTDKTPAQVTNPLVQNTVYGFRCLLFQRDDENSTIRFAGDGALNNDKGNSKSFGLEDDSDSGNDTKCQKWEFLNNTEALCSFQTDRLQEVIQTEDGEQLRVVQGLESCYPDQGDLEDEGLTPNYDHIQVLYTWVCQRANFWEASSDTLETPLTYNGVSYTNERDYRKAIFVNEFDLHFNRNHALVYYLFMEFVALCDNRAKNMFLQSFDVRSESLLNVDGETMSISEAIDSATGEVDADMIDWENSTFAVWYPVLYDLDSCFGVENSGYMQIPYYADWNYQLNGTQKFNGRESVLWLMFEEAMATDIMNEAKSLTDKAVGAGGLNYDNLYDVHIRNNAELVCPAVVNRDMEHKYNDPWINGFINYSLEGNPKQYISDYKYMQRGSRTHQKDAFIFRRSNMIYSKYKCSKFLNNNINFRCGTDGGVPASESGITILANQVLYPAVKFGDGDAAVISGAKTNAGVECVITKPGTSDTDKVGFSDTIYIAGGTFLTDIGDISKFRPYELQLQNGSGLRRLILGSSEDGYSNVQLKNVDPSGCKLLEEINVMGCTALNTVDLSKNGLIRKVYANNSSATYVALPNGGVLEELHLGSVSDLVVLNHNNLTEFSCDSYDSISQLWVENTPVIPTLEIVTERLSYLTGGLRLVGVDWTVDDIEILDRLLSSEAQGKYINNNGVLSEDQTAYPYISGTVKCSMIGSYLIEQLNKIYPDLTIEADNIVQQYLVEFKNWDGTVLDSQMIYRGSAAEDPLTRENNPITTPTRPSTVSTVYTYSGWDSTFASITANTVVTAVYSEAVRTYTVRWYNGSALLQTSTVEYGGSVEYEGVTPTDSSKEDYLIFSLFDGWTHSTGFIDQDLDVYAKFTEASAPTDKMLADMNPTELYALVKTEVLSSAGNNNTIIASGDTIDVVMGHDYEFEGVDSQEFISVGSPMVFDGTNYMDTGVKLFDEDKAFVLAIDFEFAAETATSILASCYERSGFTLKYNTNPILQWGASANTAVASGLTRELVVVRKKLGDSNLYVYASNRAGDAITETTLVNSLTTLHEAPLSFGANVQSDGYIDSYAEGTIHWAKLWMADLGETTCRKLAAWTRGTITWQAAGNSDYAFRMFTRVDNGRYVNCCLLMENLLDVTRRMDPVNTNEGGWAEAELRQWLNTRILEAWPDQWRLLFLTINVLSSAGHSSMDIVTTEDIVFIPTYKAMGFSASNAPYANESEAVFNLFTTQASRIKCLDNGDGVACNYWTCSPYYSEGSTSGDTYFNVVSTSGSSTIAYTPGTGTGICCGVCF